MDVGAYSGVVETPVGFHIFRREPIAGRGVTKQKAGGVTHVEPEWR
jgi:hypothetical protein